MFSSQYFTLRHTVIAALTAAAAVSAVAADLSPLKGFRTYSDTWRTGEEQYGLCLIPTDGSKTITSLTAGSPELRLSSGGAFTGDSYLGFDHVQLSDGQPSYSTWRRFDPVTLEQTDEGVLDYFFSCPALTYDQVSGLIYCCVADFETGGFFLGALDPSDMQLSRIADIGEQFWFAMTAGHDGSLYAVDASSALIRIDPANGSTEKVGSTGVTTYSTGSLAVDPATGRCFWSVTPAATFMGSLYEMDLTTGKASRVCVFTDADEFTGLYFDSPEAAPGAPAAPEDVRAVFANGSLSGLIQFRVPASLYDGTPAPAGEVTYTVTCSDGSEQSGSTAYGSEAEVSVAVPADGDYTFVIRLANEAGQSPVAKQSLWIGTDAPESIGRPALTTDGLTVTVAWEHPVATIHNRVPVDPAEMRYRVMRMPGSVTVGETASTVITDTPPLTDGTLSAYSYEVTAIFTPLGYESPAVSTGSVTVGTASLPYANDFGSDSLMTHFSVVDAAGDGYSWIYNAEMQAPYATYSPAGAPKDDWLISPGFVIEEGKHYRLSLDAAAMGSYNPEVLEIVLLSALSPDSGVMTLLERTVIDNSVLDGYRRFDIPFTAPGNSRAHIGIHAVSDANAYYLYVNNFHLSAGVDDHAPALPVGVAVTPAEDGSPSATISGSAPLTAFDGSELTSAVDIIVWRDGEVATTLSDVAPGAEFGCTDSPEPGRHTYRIAASNAYGAGETVEISVFVGVNCPMAPTGIVITEDGDMPGLVHLAWEAPVTDMAGQPLDRESLRYAVVDMYGNIAAEDIADCSVSVDAVPAGVDRAFARYAVYAVNEVGVSPEPGYSPMIPVGESYVGEWAESFAAGEVTTLIASSASDLTSAIRWMPVTDTSGVTAADGDGGCVVLQDAAAGVTADLITPKVTLDTERTSWIHFSRRMTPCTDVTLELLAGDGTLLDTIESFEPDDSDGWLTTNVSLERFRGRTCYFVLRGGASADRAVALDALSVSLTSALEGVDSDSSALTVVAGSGVLSVMRPEELAVSVFAPDGRAVASAAPGQVATFRLPAGVYIVRCGDRSVKTAVR